MGEKEVSDVVVAIDVLPEILAVARLPAGTAVPAQLLASSSLYAVVVTPEEVSLIVPESVVCRAPLREASVVTGFHALKVRGPLDFSAVGILASLALPLATAGVSIFALSTFDTDYILIRREALERALAALEGAGHDVSAPPASA